MNTKTRIINIASLLAVASLLACVTLPLMVLFGYMTKVDYFLYLGLATAVWFPSSLMWFVPAFFGKTWEEAGKGAWLRLKK